MRRLFILGTFLLNGFAFAQESPAPEPVMAHEQSVEAEKGVNCDAQVTKTINRSAAFLNGAARYCRLLDGGTAHVHCLEQAMAGSVNLFARPDRNGVPQVIRDFCHHAPRKALSITTGMKVRDEVSCLRAMLSELPKEAPERAFLSLTTNDELFRALDGVK